MLSFKEAFDKAITRKPSILLGNGFSISLFEKFAYDSLYKVAESIMPLFSLDLKEIFKELDTNDFEKVLANLAITQRLIKHYKTDISEKITSDLDKIKKLFIESLAKIHPPNQNILTNETKSKVRSFLSNFSQIFTTNYDLLLYWIIMSDELDKFDLPRNDGFKRLSNEKRLTWSNSAEQKIHFLHGALHFFVEDHLYKLERKENSKLTDEISKKIDEELLPLIILEGKSKQKLATINKTPYLLHSYKQLKTIDTALFILGSSLNEHSDRHIIDAITQNEKIKTIFFGLYNSRENEKDAFKKSLKANHNEIYFFDSNTAIDWKTIS